MVRRCVLFVVVALVAGSGAALAQSNNCGVVGTWTHWGTFGWYGVVSPGTSATVGQIEIEWITWDPTIGGRLPAVRTTGPKGVWEKVNQREYKYTWVAYGLDADGLPVYVLRASGVGTLPRCDRFDITGWLEMFWPTQDIWTETPFMRVPIDEFATRMPVVVAR